ncbi:DNA recombination protein RmuC [Chitinasiproducens palmae]|uniref:DNA recombination protein RmuC n=1 Tax=Chitinasiproducens palmae TaxID=1770053 RepID=A0A1H2PUS8_9BURK|nr:DNA recombination protein RmuC [Chitinasiproducens palmae]SDV50961.1 DNA recombination protein RmuC [Chitinasiproducens palmae]
MIVSILLGLVALALIAIAILGALLWQALRGSGDGHAERAALAADVAERLRAAQAESERALRSEISESGRLGRVEAGSAFVQFQQALGQQLAQLTSTQREQVTGFARELARLTEQNGERFDVIRASLSADAASSRDEQAAALQRFGDTLQQQLRFLAERNDAGLAEVRATLERKLRDIETNNAARLDEMRHVVDEKLHATLEQRLGESFRLVSERLEQVQRGLGEMQTLAAGVGDLKKVLSNVKTRGTWGEVQLEALLEQLLTSEQYAKNVATVPASAERVEFAIRLPGPEEGRVVWLPIDAKFPREDYERLLDAQDRADPAAAEEAARALDARVRLEARSIAQKYLSPPHTTDFALMFLPTEGLYAEVLRRPGLTDALQRQYRVSVAGPTTLSALLNSLQMGFRTLAIERRSSEVWQVLGAVKTEFTKFGEVLARTRSQLETVTRSIDMAERRSRAMSRKLSDVEALPEETAPHVLGQGYLGIEADDGTAP